jgi:cellulose synthase/poly-beta-1,6-N-acetylglucosamine synthase-like glycosyltransferase
MLVSVIIPLYNKARFINEAIKSIQAQTYQNWEIIVVDDGSTDDGAEVVRAIDEPRVLLVQQPNGGVSRARNHGIELAKGELICFLDADDWYGPYYLEVLATMANDDPAAQFFATGYRRLYPDQHENWSAPPPPLQCERIENFFERRRRDGHIVCTNAVAARKRVLDPLQPCFPPGESHGEDQDLWFRLAERYPMLYCPWPLVAYRMEVAGSLMTQQAAYHLVPVMCRLEQRAMAGQLRGSERRAALRLVGDARAHVARSHLQAGKRRAAMTELWRGRRALSANWFLTLVMTTLFSSGMVQRWRAWRHSRV